MAAVCSSKTEVVISQPWIPWRNLVCSSPSLSLPFHPTPSTRPPQPARGLVNAISKRIMILWAQKTCLVTTKLFLCMRVVRKKWWNGFKPVKEEVPVYMRDQPIQSHFEHWRYPGVMAVTVRRLFVFVTGRCSTIQYCTIIYSWYATMWNRQLV